MRPHDEAKAAQLLAEAAEAGNADAEYALASLYDAGRGVPADPAAAAKLYAAAAELGHIPAQVEYAIRLFNGTGVAKDEAAAAALVRARGRRPAIRSPRTGLPASSLPAPDAPPIRLPRPSGTTSRAAPANPTRCSTSSSAASRRAAATRHRRRPALAGQLTRNSEREVANSDVERWRSISGLRPCYSLLAFPDSHEFSLTPGVT